jgi:hypothetical protein
VARAIRRARKMAGVVEAQPPFFFFSVQFKMLSTRLQLARYHVRGNVGIRPEIGYFLKILVRGYFFQDILLHKHPRLMDALGSGLLRPLGQP